jgi:hypothetical protein
VEWDKFYDMSKGKFGWVKVVARVEYREIVVSHILLWLMSLE